MNKRIDLSNLGGFPMTQFTLDWMQSSYRAGFEALAKLAGDKTILYGAVVAGGNCSNGWISINGELMPLIGGAVGDGDIAIVESPTARTFEDASNYDVYFEKVATFGTPADFNFSELQPLLSLANVWRPGDIKEKYCNGAYITANFDGDGYGLNAEKGWRILSSALPDTAGKVFVNYNPADADFDTIGNTGGAKTHTLAPGEQGKFGIKAKTDDLINSSGGGGNAHVRIAINGADLPDGGGNASTYGTQVNVPLTAATDPHNNMQPYYTILKLIKL